MKIIPSVLVFLLVVITFVSARKKRAKANLRYNDCGQDPRRAIIIHRVRAHPMPVIIPGTLYITLSANLTSELPRQINIQLTAMKYFFGIPISLPCFDGKVGSCMYKDVCQYLTKYEHTGCPRTLRHHKIQCSCPFKTSEIFVNELAINIPKLGGFAGAFINGDYKVKISVQDKYEMEIGCLELKFGLKKRHRGWLFKI